MLQRACQSNRPAGVKVSWQLLSIKAVFGPRHSPDVILRVASALACCQADTPGGMRVKGCEQ
jgi:hypothetical protein